MDKVYRIVQYYDDFADIGQSTIRIFSTKEKAEEYCKKHNFKMAEYGHIYDCYEILEEEVY